MTTGELIEQLAKLPPDTQVTALDRGEPAVGIFDAVYTVSRVIVLTGVERVGSRSVPTAVLELVP